MLVINKSPEGSVEDFDGHDHELPTLETDGSALAAGPDVVVVRHVDIENLVKQN